MSSKSKKNLGQFMFTLGICGVIASCGMIVFGHWDGIYGLISGAFVAIYGFSQMKESKNI